MSNAPAATPRRNRGLKAAVITAGIALVAALAALALALSGAITIPGITQASGEIVLQGADEPGLNPFAEGLAGPAAGTAPAPVAKPIVAAATNVVSGAAIGLYGGTNDNSRCDAGQLISFLGANPSKAQAWVAALNADPYLQWGTGTLTTADIPAYIATLSPFVLLSDTVVTNHGFVNGSPTPFTSVLEAGTAVLVDRFGVPRTRCLCGNPLLPPPALPANPAIVGTPWPGFAITNAIVVQSTVGPNATFTVVPYPAGGTPIVVAAGNCVIGQPCASPVTGAPATPATPTTSPTTSPTPAPTPLPSASTTPPPAVAGQPADAVPPTGVVCPAIGANAAWVQYEISAAFTTSDFDIWQFDGNCVLTWQARHVGDPNALSGFTWMGWEGDQVWLTNRSSTVLYQGMVPAGGGPLQ